MGCTPQKLRQRKVLFKTSFSIVALSVDKSRKIMFQNFLIVSEEKNLLLYLKITINTAYYLDFKFGRFKELDFQHIMDVQHISVLRCVL